MRYLTATAASYRLIESVRASPNTCWVQPPSVRRADTQARSPPADSPEKRPHSEYTTHLFNQHLTWTGTFFLLTSGTLYGFGALQRIKFL
jgi:hypothetical protein